MSIALSTRRLGHTYRHTMPMHVHVARVVHRGGERRLMHIMVAHTPMVHTSVVHRAVVHTSMVHRAVIHNTMVHTPMVHVSVIHTFVACAVSHVRMNSSRHVHLISEKNY